MPILLIILIVAIIAFYPLAAIWSVNTLFGTAIAYSFKSWTAALLLLLMTQAGKS